MRERRLGLVLLLPLVALAGCGQGENKPARARSARLPRVEVVQPKRQPLRQAIELAASIEPLQKADLSARVPGRVEYLRQDIDIGRRVHKGERLMHLAVPDLVAKKMHKEALLEQADKQVEQARQARVVAEKEVEEAIQQEQKFVADLKFQQGKYERIRELVRMGAQDRSLAEEAKRQLETAEAAQRAAKATIGTRQAKAEASAGDLEVAKRKVEVARAEVKELEEQIKLSYITAPFDGVITRRWVDEGAVIKDAGTPLLTVMQLRRVRVLIDIPQHIVPMIDSEEDASPGKADRVTLRIEKVPNGEFKGAITRLSKALDPVTRTMRAEVELDNPILQGQRALKPGMYGKAVVLLDERADVLTVPATSLVRSGEGKMGVYIVANVRGEPERGELQLVDVELGLDNGKLVEVRKGLKGDEMVVARGNGVLRSGDEVLALKFQEE